LPEMSRVNHLQLKVTTDESHMPDLEIKFILQTAINSQQTSSSQEPNSSHFTAHELSLRCLFHVFFLMFKLFYPISTSYQAPPNSYIQLPPLVSRRGNRGIPQAGEEHGLRGARLWRPPSHPRTSGRRRRRPKTCPPTIINVAIENSLENTLLITYKIIWIWGF
jgi:hypothetical protein